MPKSLLSLCIICLLFLACQSLSPIEKYAKHFQQHQDYTSLQQVVELLPETADTALVRKLLGEPIDMGFDLRYLVDSVGPQDCVIGAVFHYNEEGVIDQKWIDEICE